MMKRLFKDLNKVDGVKHFTFEPVTPGTTPNGVPYVKTFGTCILKSGQPYRRVALAFGQDNIDLVVQAIADGGAKLSYQARFITGMVITGPAPLAQAA